ncbi:MAG: serine hydrolase [Bacteroidetes bacterium]|nr:serine hydrolase [Bacteroidota bacterium]
MKFLGIVFALCLIQIGVFAQSPKNKQHAADDSFLTNLLNQDPIYFKELMEKKDSFNIQIVYTRIDRNKKGEPSFKEFHYNLNDQHYFYPASTVKMPIAFLALEKLNDLQIKGLNKNTTMVTDSGYSGQSAVYTQPNSVDSRATIENYIKQIFLVSDNDAFNRLYEFVGQEAIQKKLAAKGYPDAIIRHRLNVSLSKEENKYTNPIKFYDSTNTVVYQQDQQYSNATYPKLSVFMGKGYLKNGTLIEQPFDFSDKNRVYLQDLHHILQSVLFPKAFPSSKRFRLTEDDRNFVSKWMSAFPRESNFPQYDSSAYWDTYCKFLLFGSEKVSVPENIKIFNKVGDAYGFLTDIAYIVDQEHHVEFLLSATISCNRDGIYNDDHYDYDEIGYPFFKHLGESILKFELSRPKN